MKLLSILLAATHSASALILLIFSGWFIAACAIAGVDYALGGFNYLLPAVVIRALALTRIASGYSQMWTGHHALLSRVKDLRLQLFARLKNQRLRRRAEGTEALAKHSETLAAITMAWTVHGVAAVLLFLFSSGAMWLWLPDFIGLWLLFWVLVMVVLSVGNRYISKDSREILPLTTDFRHLSEHHLASASLWHLYPSIKHPDMHAIASRQAHQQGHSERMLWAVEAIALLFLLFILWQGNYQGQAVLMIPVLLLLAAKDWLAPLMRAQSAKADYRISRETFEQLPRQAITAANIQPKPIKTLSLQQFTAKNRPVASIDLSLSAGQIVLLKGGSGSGKTTLLKAVAGLLPHQGKKIVNQQEIPSGFIDNWHYADQSPTLLSASLAANLRLAKPDASDSKLNQALDFADLAHLDNLSEWLGEQGRRLSGGELKRLNIARAYLFDAQLYLFDEPFEGLNNEQQQRLSTAIQTLSQHAPVIIASHIVPSNLSVQQTLLLK